MKHSLRRLPITMLVVACAAGTGLHHAAPAAAARGVAAELHLMLNVAGSRLDVYEDGERTHTYKVSIGMRGWETPSGDYRIREVIWNPWWNPPNSTWARGRKPEPPGSDENPMGRVKMHFSQLLYIHGTPEYQTLGAPASRGCVRMRNSDAIELALLVHRYATPKLDRGVIERLIETPTQTRRLPLDRPIRLTAIYRIATVSDGFLIIYPDVYRRVGSKYRHQVEIVLEQHGIDPRRVNRQRLERLLEKSETRRVAMSLDSLMTSVDSLPDERR